MPADHGHIACAQAGRIDAAVEPVGGHLDGGRCAGGDVQAQAGGALDGGLRLRQGIGGLVFPILHQHHMAYLLFVTGFKQGFVACGGSENQRHIGRFADAAEVWIGFEAAYAFVTQVDWGDFALKRRAQQSA